MNEPNHSRNAVIPSARYRDALAAIDWLCAVFGFERHAVYAQPNGIVDHAQLTFQGGMFMLGSVRQTDSTKWMAQPDETGGKETRSVYLIADNVAELYERAKSAGAFIERELRTEDYGGEGFTCRDPEGHVWSVGSYDPWPSHE